MRSFIRYPYLITLVLLSNSNILLAEDIEIYRGQSIGVRQNAVFLMDTSGSMSAEEEVDDVTFDPAVTYSDNGFDSNYYYYSNDYEGNGTDSLNVDELKKQFFPVAALACEDALDALQSVGFYNGKFKRWDASSKDWYPNVSTNVTSGKRRGTTTITIPEGSSDVSALIECKADEGENPTNGYVDTQGNDSDEQYIVTTNVGTLPSDYTTEWESHFKYLYSGNFLNFQVEYGDSTGTIKKSRMEITQDAAVAVVQGTSGIRLGLMRFDAGSEGGFVDLAVDNIEDNSDAFETKIEGYYPYGVTPLSESLYEAALYYRGEAVDYGKDSRSVVKNSNGNLSIKGTPSVDESKSGSNYLSPLTSACQTSSTIVLFTDGDPYYDTDANSKIQSMIKDITFPNNSDLSHNCSGDGGCAEELAYYLANFDQNDELEGKQVIRTYVIGGFFDETDSNNNDAIEYMEAIAKYGDGEYYSASNYADIVSALKLTLEDTADTPVTFVAPAVSANSYNSLEHLDQLYYAMFVPDSGNDWSGNLKAYRLSSDGIVVDAKNESAILENGSFSPSSRSYWTDDSITDGHDVVIGGAASLLTANYNVYTHLTTTSGALTTLLTTETISKTLIGLDNSDSDADHKHMIDWVNRISSETTDGTRREMEDPIHSRPLIVTYNGEIDGDGHTSQEGVVFVGTNSGYLHAFKADHDEYVEYFSYIPQELLANVPTYVNGSTLADKTYGIDGPINYWHDDINKNGQVDLDNNEKVLLFFGLRRGGSNYYALDVSNPEEPEFAWQITGGVTGSDFEKVGQTWSNMELAKVTWQGESKVVLLFGAGYDVAQDNLSKREADDLGNAVYMVDANTGEQLWHASPNSSDLKLTAMTNSITADIVPIDYDGDQITDYFFASDVGGRVWRFDINKENSKASEFATAGMIFDANGDANSPYQRFYHAPSISYFTEEDSDGFLSLAIGSGFRAHPLESGSEDSFYILKDYNLISAPETYTKLTPAGLADLASSHATDEQLRNGWKLALPEGEKNLSKALTTNGDIFFTTFSPTVDSDNDGSCLADIGSSYAYYIDVKGDNKETDDDTDDGTDPPIIVIRDPIENPGILPEPIVLLPPNPKCSGDDCDTENPTDSCETIGSVILSGTQTLSGGISRCELVQRDYWLQNK